MSFFVFFEIRIETKIKIETKIEFMEVDCSVK